MAAAVAAVAAVAAAAAAGQMVAMAMAPAVGAIVAAEAFGAVSSMPRNRMALVPGLVAAALMGLMGLTEAAAPPVTVLLTALVTLRCLSAMATQARETVVQVAGKVVAKTAQAHEIGEIDRGQMAARVDS